MLLSLVAIFDKHSGCHGNLTLGKAIIQTNRETYKTDLSYLAIRQKCTCMLTALKLICVQVSSFFLSVTFSFGLCVQVRISIESQGLISLLANALVKY